MQHRYRNEEQSFIQRNGRYLFFVLVLLIFFAYLIWGLASLQLNAMEEHQADATKNKTTKLTLTGKRGTIMDADSVFLATDEQVYNITFYRDGSQRGKENYEKFTQSISDTIDIIEKNGNELNTTFEIQRDEETDEWIFNFGSGVSETVLEEREKLWRNNHYLTDKNKYGTAEQTLTKLKERYQIPEGMNEERMLKIMSVYSTMQMNLFASQPIVIAKEVPYSTVLEIETQSMLLPGMAVEIGTKRVYPKHNLAAQVIGFTGVMTSKAWETYGNQGYKYNDTYGKDGIEATMEDWLTPNSTMRRGYKTVERNSMGKITDVLEVQDPQDGNNVKLTLRSNYQQRAEEAIAYNVAEIRKEQNKLQVDPKWREKNRGELETRNWEGDPLKLAQNGAMVVIDMQGRVLAMANYPTYDLNAMVLAGKEAQEIIKDDRSLMLNYAIQAKGAPGSIFKMVTGFAALQEKQLTLDETISDGGGRKDGRFIKHMQLAADGSELDEIDYSSAPKCWTNNRQNHQNLDIVKGISNSCNYFFYEIGYRLYQNGDKLGKYASLFGLTSTTGIELPGEARSVMASQNSLYDPSRAVTETYQDSSKASLVYYAIIRHLSEVGASYNVTYEQERMEKCALRLLQMAEQTNQSDWDGKIRTILMEELNMTQQQVQMRTVYSEIYFKLNDMKWGGGEAIMAAIGQSVTSITPAAAARYTAAVANGGDLYNLMLVDSIISPEGEVMSQKNPSNNLVHHIEGGETYLPSIREGMKGVVDEGGTATKYFGSFKYRSDIAGKTGTAENSKVDLENHSWLVSFMPFDNPEIAVVVFVPNGYSGSRGAIATRQFAEWYFDQREIRQEDVPLPAGNQLSP